MRAAKQIHRRAPGVLRMCSVELLPSFDLSQQHRASAVTKNLSAINHKVLLRIHKRLQDEYFSNLLFLVVICAAL